jgi:hypothetical protein
MTTSFTSFAFPASGGPVSGVSPVGRTLPDRLNDVINVKDFGAKGDGVTDDTDALYSASIRAFSRGLGATIFVPAGTYLIGSPPFYVSYLINLVATTGGASGVDRTVDFSFLPSALARGMIVGNSGSFFAKGSAITAIDLAHKRLTFNNACNRNFSPGDKLMLLITGTHTENGSVKLVGAARDSTILRGSYSNGNLPSTWDPGYLVQSIGGDYGGQSFNGFSNLTIWNESTAALSGAYIDLSNMNPPYVVENCTFVGNVAAHLGYQSFGADINSCRFLSSGNVSTASPTGPPPASVFPTVGQGTLLSGSVGLYFSQGEIANCYAEGFDTGFALSQNAITMYACRASRCNTGLWLGLAASISANPTRYPSPVNVISCLFDRCSTSIHEEGGLGARCGNLICGNLLNNVRTGTPVGPFSDSPLNPAAISSIVVAGGTATVTTALPHGLGSSGTSHLELILSPSSLTPDGSGNQVVSVILTGATTFTYSLGGSGTFSHPGTWNHANAFGVSGNFSQAAYFANVLTSKAFFGSFALWESGVGTSSSSSSFVCATEGPYGWFGPLAFPNTDPTNPAGAAFSYIMCGMPASASLTLNPSNALPNPLAYLKFAALAAVAREGKEINITDGKKSGGGSATFGDVVTGGGTDHYKVRYDGKNWRRVG